MEITVTGLYHYPVKSLAGVPLERAHISTKGIEGDRRWVIVNKDGLFQSQRQRPRMALLVAQWTANGILLQARGPDMPAQTSLEVCLPGSDAERIGARVWKDELPGFVAEEAVNRWITEALQADEPLRLVHHDSNAQRLPGSRFGEDATVYADAAPLLVVNAQSLHRLNGSLYEQQLPEVDIRHFRPNIVISGLPGFAEHGIARLYHPGGAVIRLVDACQRCAIITVDPHTGQRLPGAVPFKQLAAINPMPDNPKAPAFGMNAALELTEESLTKGLDIRVGDKLALNPPRD